MTEELKMRNIEPIRDAAVPVLRGVGLTKYFGGVRALDAVSLDLIPGEIVALVGDNGAGKSTLVKIFSGIYQADEGSLWVGETKCFHLTARRARELGIETVYQQLFLCDNLGAAANVTLGQEPVHFRVGPFQIIDKKKSVEEARQHIAELGIDLTDLDTPVRRFSGGQRQAIAIARATLSAHRLIQFDEPTAALGVRQTQATLGLDSSSGSQRHRGRCSQPQSRRRIRRRATRCCFASWTDYTERRNRGNNAGASRCLHDRHVVSAGRVMKTPGRFSGFTFARGRNVGLLSTLIFCLLLISLFSPKYLSIDNLLVVALQVSFIGIAAVGTAYLIIGGSVDLSIGSQYALCAGGVGHACQIGAIARRLGCGHSAGSGLGLGQRPDGMACADFSDHHHAGHAYDFFAGSH